VGVAGNDVIFMNGYTTKLRLLVTANVVLSSLILVTLMMEALGSSKTSVLTTAIWRNISEDGILHSHRRETLKFYVLKLVSVERTLNSYHHYSFCTGNRYSPFVLNEVPGY
jgi:hypothetical protein